MHVDFREKIDIWLKLSIFWLKYWLVWKVPISIYFMAITCISIFTWANIAWITTNSNWGIINYALAILLKCLQFYFCYFLLKLLPKKKQVKNKMPK